MFRMLNSWHSSTVVSYTGDTHEQAVVNYLDLDLAVENSSVTWSLHEKPQNLHLFVPWCSGHPLSTFKSVVTGGFHRIAHRFKSSCDPRLADSYRSFIQRLQHRGYPRDFILKFRNNKKTFKVIKKRVFFKYTHHPCVATGTLRRALNRCSIVDVSVNLSCKTAPNSFRRAYRSTWLRRAEEGGL